jgi:ring-1,2-phenylacetyl-CoA epoxidase subunit PaaD
MRADARDAAYDVLREVLDPEVPVLSVVDLGIVRDVEVDEDRLTVVVTPTYSGCPAMRVIEREIVAALEERGFPGARVRTSYAPAWTTEWITPAGREKLRAYGIAPPGPVEVEPLVPLVPLVRRRVVTACPFCGSPNTELRSEFGSTACKALMYCNGCRQPFERFKSI